MLYEPHPANPIEQVINILEEYISIPKRDFNAKYTSKLQAFQHLSSVMNSLGFLVEDEHEIFIFFELITEAEKAISNLKKYKDKSRQELRKRLQPIHKLKDYFIYNALIEQNSGEELQEYLNVSNIVSTLISFNDDFLDEKGKVVRFSGDFIIKLLENFEALEKEVIESDLDTDAKGFISRKISEILEALKNYKIYGTEYLKKVANSSIGSFMLEGSRLSDSAKQNPLTKKCLGKIIALVVASVGFANDYENYLMPKYEKFEENAKAAEKLNFYGSGSEGVVRSFEDLIDSQEGSVNLISGTEDSIKSLPKGDVEKY